MLYMNLQRYKNKMDWWKYFSPIYQKTFLGRNARRNLSRHGWILLPVNTHNAIFYCLQHQFLHDEVGVGIGVAAVVVVFLECEKC